MVLVASFGSHRKFEFMGLSEKRDELHFSLLEFTVWIGECQKFVNLGDSDLYMSNR